MTRIPYKPKPLDREHFEQVALINWTELNANRLKMVDTIFSIPNKGFKSAYEGFRRKIEGRKPGVPDLFLPVPLWGFAVLFIELKAPALGDLKAGRASVEQKAWILILSEAGYKAAVCVGWLEAVECIEKYYKGAEKGKFRPEGVK